MIALTVLSCKLGMQGKPFDACKEGRKIDEREGKGGTKSFFEKCSLQKESYRGKWGIVKEGDKRRREAARGVLTTGGERDRREEIDLDLSRGRKKRRQLRPEGKTGCLNALVPQRRKRPGGPKPLGSEKVSGKGL